MIKLFVPIYSSENTHHMLVLSKQVQHSTSINASDIIVLHTISCSIFTFLYRLVLSFPGKSEITVKIPQIEASCSSCELRYVYKYFFKQYKFKKIVTYETAKKIGVFSLR
jgi:hypothetical protein